MTMRSYAKTKYTRPRCRGNWRGCPTARQCTAGDDVISAVMTGQRYADATRLAGATQSRQSRPAQRSHRDRQFAAVPSKQLSGGRNGRATGHNSGAVRRLAACCVALAVTVTAWPTTPVNHRLTTAITAPHCIRAVEESGSYLALDLGGTNFRVMNLQLKDGRVVDETVSYYHVDEHLRIGCGYRLFDFLAECIADFVHKQNLGGQRLPLGNFFFFPLILIFLYE